MKAKVATGGADVFFMPPCMGGFAFTVLVTACFMTDSFKGYGYIPKRLLEGLLC